MLRRLHQLRAFVTTLLLVVQVLGLGHVALARHTLSESGALVDVAPLLVEVHDDDETHLCADEVAIHADAPGDCLVVATWSSPLLVTPGTVASPHAAEPHEGVAAPVLVAVQLDALTRAPKASPPRG